MDILPIQEALHNEQFDGWSRSSNRRKLSQRLTKSINPSQKAGSNPGLQFWLSFASPAIRQQGFGIVKRRTLWSHVSLCGDS
jgi:hypothetical protein